MEDLLKIEKIWEILDEICDPEIPVVSIKEMGMLRDIQINNDEIEIIITPTYTGCPAMYQIEHDIKEKLILNGFANSKVITKLSPPWTTEWMTDSTKQKLKEYGIAPPVGNIDTSLFTILKKTNVECPFCDSNDTSLTSQFGATACKSLHFCNSCKQPFEHFKCH